LEFKGHLVGATRNLTTGKYNITFELDEGNIKDLDRISGNKELMVQAKVHRNKRSLDSNAYAWVLMQKIAEATGLDKWDVYLNCLQRYSRAFTHVIVKPNAIDRLKELYRVCIDLGEVTVNGKTGHQLQVYFGSSTFDTKEMSVFIDGIVSECKDLEIELLPPSEIERMKKEWGK
jgi:hypothetical protein